MFLPLALLWLPLGLILSAELRGLSFLPVLLADPSQWLLFSVNIPGGLFLPFGARALHRLGWRRTAWTLGLALAPVTVLFATMGGLLGIVGIVGFAAAASLPVWALAGAIRTWRGRHARRRARTP